MIKFDDLPDSDKLARLRLLMRACLQMAMASQATLIARGLISPDEFSTVVQPVIDTIEEMAGMGDDDISTLIEGFATMKSLAAQTWKGK